MFLNSEEKRFRYCCGRQEWPLAPRYLSVQCRIQRQHFAPTYLSPVRSHCPQGC